MNRIPKIETLSLFLVFTYMAMHIPEEAFGGFPAFMADNWGILNIGYARWLFHNAVFFAPVLIGALVIQSIDSEKFKVFGFAVLLWGVFNFMEHAFFTIKNFAVSPGFYSALVFLALAVLGILKLYSERQLKRSFIAKSICIGIGLWVISISLILIFGSKVALMVGYVA